MTAEALEDGTYTVLVTEINASGRDGRRRSGSRDAPLREIVVRHGGVDVGETRGGVAVAFPRAPQAGRCAGGDPGAQRAPAPPARGLPPRGGLPRGRAGGPPG